MRRGGSNRRGDQSRSSHVVVCASQRELSQTRMGNWIGRDTPSIDYAYYSYDSYDEKE